jgi:hypothetical protein
MSRLVKGQRVFIEDSRGGHHGTVEGVLRSGLLSVRWDSGVFERCGEEELQPSDTVFDREEEELTPTGHVIGATYWSAYWGGTYKVIGPDMRRDWGVEVECVLPGGGAHQTVGQRWTHSTMLDSKDVRVA